MRKASIVSAGLACLIALAAGGDALAKSRNRQSGYSVSQNRGPIEVERRSFLDPGTKVPVGSNNRYMVQQTFNNQDPIEANQRSWYMQETLPRKYDVPWEPGLPVDWFGPE